MNCLRPLITHSSPLSTAFVCIAASGALYGSQRSEAPRGSVRQCASRNPGSFTMRGNQYSWRLRGATLRSSTETFQICTSLSERPESPRAISSDISAKVCTSWAGSSGTPPNSSGTPSVRMPILSACSRIARGRRASGSISHSRCQFWRMKGVTKSSTKARQLARISRCSSDRLRSIVSMTGVFYRMPSVLRSASGQRDKIVFADALQHEEARRGVAAVDHEVRALRPDRERLAGPEAHLLLGIAQEDADLPLEHVEGVLDVVVVMPGHLLLRRDLQLVDAEAGALRVERAPLDFVEMARVLHRFHDGLLESIAEAPSISPPGTGSGRGSARDFAEWRAPGRSREGT